MLSKLISQLINSQKNKILLEVGAHDDTESIELAKNFKKVYAYYEFVKIPERNEANLEIKRLPFLEILKDFDRFDVVLMENEFHHFPDIWQMWTYDKLNKNQELLIVEWNKKGNNNEYYQCFQNCEPLCNLTKQIMNKFVAEGVIKIENILEGSYIDEFNSEKEIVNNFKFMLPDHWKYGEKEFMQKIKNLQYPVKLSEGFDIFKIVKI
jgi:hypothetical protein